MKPSEHINKAESIINDWEDPTTRTLTLPLASIAHSLIAIAKTYVGEEYNIEVNTGVDVSRFRELLDDAQDKPCDTSALTEVRPQ